MKEIPVIIVNYRDYARRYLADFAASLRAVTDVPWKLYIIDNQTTPQSREYLSSAAPEAVIMPYKRNLGYSSCSFALRELEGKGYEYALIANMDMEVTPDFFKPLVDFISHDAGIASVQPRIMLHGHDDVINSLGNAVHFLGFGYSVGEGNHWSEYAKEYQAPREIAYASGAATLVRLSIVKKIGLYDEDYFMYHEDLDFGWRARLSGYRNCIVPQSVVYHKYEFAKSMSQYYHMERNRFICLYKNYAWLTLLLILPALIATECAVFAFSFRSGFWREKIRAYAAFFHPSLWRRLAYGRRRSQALRRMPDAEILKCMTGEITAIKVKNPVLSFGNAVLSAYLSIIRKIIFW